MDPVGVRDQGQPVRDRAQVRPERIGGPADVPADRPGTHAGQHDAGLPCLSHHLVNAVQPPHRQQSSDAAAEHPDHVLSQEVFADVLDVRHQEELQVRGVEAAQVSGVVEVGDAPRSITRSGVQQTHLRCATRHPRQVDGVVGQRADLETGPSTRDESARRGQDGRMVCRHVWDRSGRDDSRRFGPAIADDSGDLWTTRRPVDGGRAVVLDRCHDRRMSGKAVPRSGRANRRSGAAEWVTRAALGASAVCCRRADRLRRVRPGVARPRRSYLGAGRTQGPRSRRFLRGPGGSRPRPPCLSDS